MRKGKLRSKVAIVHYRRAGVNTGRPWTVHYAGQCIPAASVVFKVPCETIFKPEKKANPKAWMRAHGLISIDANSIVTIY